MTRQRLRCFVSGSRDPAEPNFFPEDDDHPCWMEVDALGEAIYARFTADGLTDAEMMDNLLTTSSDTPWGCTYFWVDLPHDLAQRCDVLALCLDHLSRARLALPNVGWELTLEEAPLAWNGTWFSLPA